MHFRRFWAVLSQNSFPQKCILGASQDAFWGVSQQFILLSSQHACWFLLCGSDQWCSPPPTSLLTSPVAEQRMATMESMRFVGFPRRMPVDCMWSLFQVAEYLLAKASSKMYCANSSNCFQKVLCALAIDWDHSKNVPKNRVNALLKLLRADRGRSAGGRG